ncbi:MAG: 16S rRNA (guanine(527)-N(7))-methyltransferase RsmG [Planctomycetes bacterium]|nr:16S rRNA (guanine(527)-N(7))-methyltransferase RsmG [Planctomycetota bacterium]
MSHVEASDSPRGRDAEGREGDDEALSPADAGAEGAEPAPAKKGEDPDAKLLHAATPLPSLDELRAAMEWAFTGLEVEASVLDRYAAHAREVLAGNQRMNLTAIVDPKEVAAKHYLDSWRATRIVPLMGRSLLDVGTGAGFPGVPIALAEPHAKVGLLDSLKKRADFVGETIAKLAIKNAFAVSERAEEHLARHRYDIVLMRAISSVRENVRLLRKVRHSHKDLVMFKGPSWSREVRAAEREAERLGFRLDTVIEHKLPGEMGDRAILVYRAPGGHGV